MKNFRRRCVILAAKGVLPSTSVLRLDAREGANGMKRNWLWLLCFALCLALAGCSADGYIVSGEYMYYKCEYYQALEGYQGDASELTLPTELNGVQMKIVSGNKKAREQGYTWDGLTSVVIPEGYTEIWSAFEGCGELASVTLPSTLQAIKSNAFADCSSLTQIQLPEGLMMLDRGAFRNAGLTAVHIPDSVSILGEYYPTNPFVGCAALKEITFSAAHPSLRWEDGAIVRRSYDVDTLIVYPGYAEARDEYVVPASVKRIAEYAFSDATIRRIVLPEGLTDVYKGAFTGCTGLEEVVVPASVESIDGDAFLDCEQVMLVVPYGSYAEEYAKGKGMTYRYSDRDFLPGQEPTATPTIEPAATPTTDGTNAVETKAPSAQPSDAIAAPTREELLDAGLELPEMSAGETLYLGAAAIPEAEHTYVAIVASADGKTLSSVTIYIKNLNLQTKNGSALYILKYSSLQNTYNGPITRYDVMELTLGESALTNLSLSGDSGEGLLMYVLNHKPSGASAVQVPLTPARVAFVKR